MAAHSYGAFRRGAFAATAIASLSVGSLFPGQAFAQTAPVPANYQGTAACAKYAKNDPALSRAVQCEAREWDRRIAAEKQKGAEADQRRADAIQRGKEADRRGAEADRVSACTGFLIAGVKSGQFTKGAVLGVANGKLTAANACDAARSFGYSQKAELDHPSVR